METSLTPGVIFEIDRNLAGFVLIQAMSGDQFRQMGAIDGQRFDGPEQTHGDGADLRIREKESLRIQMKWSAHKWPMKWSNNIAIRGGSGQDSRDEYFD